MILGIGHDLVDINRIRRLLKLYIDQLPLKVLSSEELAVYSLKSNKTSYLAKRFAAKEALVKALGIGLRKPLYMTNISVLNDNLGRPYFKFSPEITDVLASYKISKIHLSLSDEREMASAVVLLDS